MLPLQAGSRVKVTKEGHCYTGTVEHLCHISNIIVDSGYVDSLGYHDRLYFYYDATTGKSSNARIELLEDRPNSEYALTPLSDIAAESYRKQYSVTLAKYRETMVNRLRKYTARQVKVTCEYGHTHTVSKQIAVEPTIDESKLTIAYFFYCLAEYAHYLENVEFTRKCEAWHRLCHKLALSGLTYAGDYTGVDDKTRKAIQAGLAANYEAICQDYKAKIFGAQLERYNRQFEPKRINYVTTGSD
jgi:hypothetical protein